MKKIMKENKIKLNKNINKKTSKIKGVIEVVKISWLENCRH
jgi:hypothetical protein